MFCLRCHGIATRISIKGFIVLAFYSPPLQDRTAARRWVLLISVPEGSPSQCYNSLFLSLNDPTDCHIITNALGRCIPTFLLSTPMASASGSCPLFRHAGHTLLSPCLLSLTMVLQSSLNHWPKWRRKQSPHRRPLIVIQMQPRSDRQLRPSQRQRVFHPKSFTSILRRSLGCMRRKKSPLSPSASRRSRRQLE